MKEIGDILNQCASCTGGLLVGDVISVVLLLLIRLLVFHWLYNEL